MRSKFALIIQLEPSNFDFDIFFVCFFCDLTNLWAADQSLSRTFLSTFLMLVLSIDFNSLIRSRWSLQNSKLYSKANWKKKQFLFKKNYLQFISFRIDFWAVQKCHFLSMIMEAWNFAQNNSPKLTILADFGPHNF